MGRREAHRAFSFTDTDALMLALRPDVTSSFARAADIEELISLGAARVVIGILAVESPTEWERPVGRFGSSVCV